MQNTRLVLLKQFCFPKKPSSNSNREYCRKIPYKSSVFKSLPYFAVSIFLSINPCTFGDVSILLVVGAQPVLGVVRVGPDENVPRGRVEVTTPTVKIAVSKMAFVVTAITENLVNKF